MRAPIKHRPSAYAITPSGSPLSTNMYRVMVLDGDDYKPSRVVNLSASFDTPPVVGDIIEMDWRVDTFLEPAAVTLNVLSIVREVRPDTSYMPALPTIQLDYPCLICGVRT